VCEQLDASGWDTCFVVDEPRVVLGRIGRRAIRRREDVTAEEAMTLGPSTIRPSARLEAMVERMRRQELTNLPVTSGGRLVGLLTLRDAAGRAATSRLLRASLVFKPHWPLFACGIQDSPLDRLAPATLFADIH
jgi:CBS-domain-containing membrane protein